MTLASLLRPSYYAVDRAAGRLAAAAALVTLIGAPSAAQETRAGVIAAQQAEKAEDVEPYRPNRVEEFVNRLEERSLRGGSGFYPWFDSALAGGGFTFGAGYRHFVGSYSSVGVRGSWTVKNYKRIEVDVVVPQLIDRRGRVRVMAGWRDATQVGFYGTGTASTSKADRVNFSLTTPSVEAAFDFAPWRQFLSLTAFAGLERPEQGGGSGSAPSIGDVYTGDDLPGLGARPSYVRTGGTLALDWRPADDYARRGGVYRVTVVDYADRAERFGFRRTEYEAIQHLPILRDTWVLSLRARVHTTDLKDGQTMPFFMHPAIGGGSTLRAFKSWRFRDRHTLLLSAEWRVMLNEFLDMAAFYDAGKAVAHRADLDLDGLKSGVGIGFRFHGPGATPLRIELAHGNEGLHLVFSSHAAF